MNNGSRNDCKELAATPGVFKKLEEPPGSSQYFQEAWRNFENHENLPKSVENKLSKKSKN